MEVKTPDVCTEYFREIVLSEIPKVLETLNRDWPKHFVLHQLLRVFMEYQKKKTKFKNSLYLYGTLHDGVFLNITKMELGDKEAIKIYVDATARDTSMVTKALSETDIIPWEKTFTFTHIHSDYSTIIQGVLASHKANSFDVSPNNMFWFPSGKTIRMSELPQDTICDFLDGSHADEMNQNWPHRSPRSELVLKENIEKNFGLGIFRISDRLLISSALCNYAGGIFVLYTNPEFRGRSYASKLVQRMVLEIRKRGWIPFCTVILGNKRSEAVFRNVGFEKFSFADYLIAR
ncbi:uncharacterized protein LOC128998349 isoform X1 [Macrosteles quadrilineatus]|uniref:uncharacterized protein LOC128998349 isoform X1 n=2 Tax=Macrosteles quadrilineatus TaxID=74068 RepID=UPI0023E19145|nr:uncharacterized protein LOC128998349 isoform X1 [Macrosteles quadrilineatus]